MAKSKNIKKEKIENEEIVDVLDNKENEIINEVIEKPVVEEKQVEKKAEKKIVKNVAKSSTLADFLY